MALTFTPKLDTNFKLPNFSCLGVDNKTYSHLDFTKDQPLWVMFICNHCPYVKAIEDRILVTAKKLQELGFLVLAICSNDPTDYAEDSFENLQKRWKEKNYSFPYLYDENQQIAKSFGAVCTPDFYLFDKSLTLKYRGRLDDNWKDSNLVKSQELLAAAEKILNMNYPLKPAVPSMGCSIKWK